MAATSRTIQRRGGSRLMNKEGYRDPTAEKAIHNADKMPKYIQNIFDKLNLAAGKSGVEVLVIRDKETGRKYRR